MPPFSKLKIDCGTEAANISETFVTPTRRHVLDHLYLRQHSECQISHWLCLLKHHMMKGYGGVGVYIHTFLILDVRRK
jgi:hypothetical protein